MSNVTKKMTPLKLLQHAQFHGANRLADKTTRWFWAPALLILLGPAIALVVLTVNRYQEKPTYMVQHDIVYDVKQFPSVILCPEVNFVEDRIDDFLNKLKYLPGMNPNNTREILPQLAAFYSLDVLYNLQDLTRLENLLDYNGFDVETVGMLLTATCEETLIKCRWGLSMVNCSDLFHMEVTGDGFCCVFNGRSLRQEMSEYGNNIKRTPTRRNWFTKSYGFTSGLMIAINQRQKPTTVDLGYKWIALQTGQEYVDTTMNGTAVSPGAEHWIAYHATGFQIAIGAKALSPALRKCNMSTDKLRYFPIYSHKYCLLEKEMANTLEKCHCVRTTHPRPPGTNRCRAKMLLCATQAMIGVEDITDCPLTCDVEHHSVVASSFTLDESVKTIEPFYNGLNYKKVSVVRVFIQSRKLKTNVRWSYFDYLDLFSQLGGMFSVFFGCSILTLLGLLQLAWRVAVTQWQKLRK